MMAADITNCPIIAGNSINTSLIFLLHGGGEEVMGEVLSYFVRTLNVFFQCVQLHVYSEASFFVVTKNNTLNVFLQIV